MATSAEIHGRLGHPVIDIDGHMAEHLPTLAPYLEQEGLSLDHPVVPAAAAALRRHRQSWHDADPRGAGRHPHAARVRGGAPRPGSTIDLATALFPELLYERLDELGIDFGVVYPSLGLVFLHTDDEDVRRGACRALNRCNAETFAPLADRLAPVAAIPMHTPDEAVAELEYAVNVLGFKAVLCAGYVQRPFEAAGRRGPRAGAWTPSGSTSSASTRAYDYDPVWAAGAGARGVDRIPLRLHRDDARTARSRATCTTTSSMLAEGQQSLAKSLFLGGVTRRFPDMNFAFLEGGVAWAGVALQRHHRPLGEAQPRRAARATSIRPSSTAT